ncbi:hypothetical protein FC88_GL001808 [Companilactobacillus futsaii JCM 17355]|nr:hypothetical protein FC88_GL001808 [Companilactobacillus futsaii JCM 17355]
MIFNITIIIIAIALIVGVILSSIALLKISHALKLRNQMLKQVSRAYLNCTKNNNQLEIRNIGQVPLTIDKIVSSEKLNMTLTTIAPNQVYYFQINGIKKLSLSIDYHDQLNHYSEEFDL